MAKNDKKVQNPVDDGNFAEDALRIGGKSEEEARRTGDMDRENDNLESTFDPKYQTKNSPIHVGVWDGETPLDSFLDSPKYDAEPWQPAMDASVAAVQRMLKDGTLLKRDEFDGNDKVTDYAIAELGKAGYWGMLISPEYGGQGAPIAAFMKFLTRMAAEGHPAVAGLASIHGCIGAVDPTIGFDPAFPKTGDVNELRARVLPMLASGKKISAFALTEPGAGSDLTAVKTTATLKDDHYLINGEKLFITNVAPGRIIGLVCLVDGKPATFVVELPETEDETFQLVRYEIHAVKNLYNRGIKFNNFRVPKENLLKPQAGNGLTIAYHGLNRGRVALCANAAGVMRVMLKQILPWAEYRRTYGQTINSRELVKRRIGRLAGMIVAADGLVDWCSNLLDAGYRGELECIVAKIFGSEAQKEAAIEIFMKTHGGRAFLKGHLFGDNLPDYLAPCIYEGEGEMLAMAFFAALAKEHGKQFMLPIGKKVQATGIKKPNPINPVHFWKFRQEFMKYGFWMIGKHLTGADKQKVSGLDRKLQKHLSFALKGLSAQALEVSGAMTKHQLKLADRQCRMVELSQRVQKLVIIVSTVAHAHKSGDAATRAAADIFCQDLIRELTGARPSDTYFHEVSKLADMVIAGEFKQLKGVDAGTILRKYDQK